MGNYVRYHSRRINGRSRNEPIPMEPGELEAMAAEVRSRRNTDGMSRKERREAYVREREILQGSRRADGGKV